MHGLNLAVETGPPITTLFPYTTLFRSRALDHPRAELVAPALCLGGRAAATEPGEAREAGEPSCERDRKSTRLNSSYVEMLYAVLCLKKKIIGVVGLCGLTVCEEVGTTF